MTRTKVVRCAIYTRKSSDEGLDQEFNSLNAQRESCEAYILSQKAEGWSALRDQYDDGGYSGGTLERPALQRLLKDIEAGRVDVVVVYKIDRLSRSLMDFAKLVDVFDRKGVTFVSITQSFNTTTSMGRLTLNVLLSFAQFEREVAGERIRDKFAASKKKGMWMGGVVPLGYDVANRKLVVNEAEAEMVRMIFKRYLALGSVRLLRDELERKKIISKVRALKNGSHHGGVPYDRGALTHILKSRTYIGEVAYQGASYPGEHNAIISRQLFDAVQSKLAAGAHEHRRPTNQPSKAKLSGLLFDDRNNPMRPVYTSKQGGCRYCYYQSAAIGKGRPALAGSITRVPAAPIEELIDQTLGRLDLALRSNNGVPAVAGAGAKGLTAPVPAPVRRIEIKAQTIAFSLNRDAVFESWRERDDADDGCRASKLLSRYAGRLTPGESLTEEGDALLLTIPVRAKFRGGRTQVLSAQGSVASASPQSDPALIKAIARAHAWTGILLRGEAKSIADIARQVSKHRGDIAPILKLAFLSPDITRAILEGRQSPTLTLTRLLNSEIPLSWAKQAELFN
jgi:DNA invertase Pin-like site-specific DNA recombinase